MSISTSKASFKTVNIFNVTTDPKINVTRFSVDHPVYGVVVNDDHNIPQMMSDILAEGKIIEPLWINKRKDGTMIAFRGNRRTNAAHALKANPNTPQGVLDALKETPAWVFNDLTDEEMIEAVNDQSTKRFSTSGVIVWIWRLLEQGKTYKELAPLCWNQFESWPSKKMQDAIKRVAAMPEGKERDVESTKVLKSCLDQEIILAHRLGERVQKAYLTGYLKLDSLVPVETKPEFKTPRDRLAKLAQAMEADKLSPGGWNCVEGGAAFNAVIEAFIAEDEKGKPRKDNSTRPTATEFDEIVGALQSKVAQDIASYAKTKIANGLVQTDKVAFQRELACKKFLDLKSNVDATKLLQADQVVELIDAVINGNRDLVEKHMLSLAKA